MTTDIAAEYRHGERISALEKEREHLVTKADLRKVAFTVMAANALVNMAIPKVMSP